MSKSLDRTQWTRQAESVLLGAIISNGDLADTVFQIVKPNQFSQYRKVAELLAGMNGERIEIDYISTTARANGSGADVEQCVNEYQKSNLVATDGIIRQWSAEVRNNARRIELEERLIKSLNRLKAETDITRAERYILDTLSDCGIAGETGKLESLKDVATNYVGEFAERFNDPQATWGLSTGFAKLDAMLGGLEDESLYLIAARPSVGKTALALAMANHIVSIGTPAAFFSLEMSKKQLLTRLVCMRGRFNSYAVRTGLMNKSKWSDELRRRFFDEYDTVSALPLWIDDTGGITTRETRARVHSFMREHQARVLFFDYINLAGNTGENRNIEVGSVVRGLKEIAKEFHIPVVALAQLSRKSEGRDNKEPQLADLRDSGELEQVAQVVIFLHRDDYINRGNEMYKPNHQCKIIVSKNQSGAVGYTMLRFEEETTRFEDGV